jgi:hypothetical protein
MPVLSKDRLQALEQTVEYMIHVSRIDREYQAALLAEARILFGVPFLAGDVHTHSTFSDGVGTVEDNWSMAKAAGLDFMFATDHNTIRQKSRCRHRGLWLGQEPSLGGHHIALLGLKKTFVPKKDGLIQDFERAASIAPFVFFPHPVGWWPDTWYPEERIRQLDGIGEPFALEVINGANKLDRAYDQFDDAAVKLWDRLLCMNRHVTGLGGSDAHLPQGIGNVWTGVYDANIEMNSVIESLKKGHCFVSEGPLVYLNCEGKTMGDTVKRRKGSKLQIDIKAVYVPGLFSLNIVSRGRVVRSFMGNNEPQLRAQHSATVGVSPTYFRLEARGVNDRRAFSNPIYVKPE